MATKKEIICPWCEKKTTSEKKILTRDNTQVSERRCEHCDKLLAAYMDSEKGFLPRIRVFE